MRLAAFSACLLLAACGGGGSADSASGTPRAFNRTDSSVTVLPNTGAGFTATEVVTISNDDGGATFGDVSLVNPVGSLSSSPSSSGGYQIQVTLTATAPSESQAREALATMTVVHRDALGGGTLYLDNEVKFAQYNANNVNRTASVSASLPPALDYRMLEEHVEAGSAASSGFSGAQARIDSTSGSSTLSGTWDSAAVNSESGAVTASGDIAALQASSVSGTVQATLACVRTTQATLDSVSGGIDVTVAQNTGSGFDLVADTTSGSATIVVAGTAPVGDQSTTHAHYRSANYASANPQISVSGQTTSGGVSIHD